VDPIEITPDGTGIVRVPSESAPGDGAAVAAPTALDVPRDTTPTFELEMLVSGAILVGLLQLPPLIDAFAAHFQPHYGLAGIFLGVGVTVLGKAAINSLLFCFVLHLALRGYWVACVGVESVFPRGIRWERMRESGPIARELLRERLRALPPTIARLDNAASLVFAAGFVLAAATLSGAVGIVVMFVAFTTARALGVFERPEIVAPLCALLLLPFPLAALLDLKMGDRLRGRVRGVVRAMIRVQLALMPASASTLQSVIGTNADKRAVYGFLGAGFVVSVALPMVGLLGGGMPGGGMYRYFADEQPTRALRADFYDDQRDEPSITRPSIASAVATGPYVRLFVPYVILRHEDAFARACPGLRPLTDVENDESPEAAAAADAVLRCALRVHRPALDGRPLDATGFRFHADPRTNRRGFVMFVPIAGLAPGEHRLTIWPARAQGARPARAPYTIPFWK
jgi:hypothetical protein